MKQYHPLKELFFTRVREFAREPAVLFWVYGFPLLLALALGVAFRNRAVEKVFVDIEAAPSAEALLGAFTNQVEFAASIHPRDESRERLRLGKTALVVVPGDPVRYRFDPTRPESAAARNRVDEAIQRHAGRKDPVTVAEEFVQEPGARYIDFLMPGLLGMNLMGGGLWGVGYLLVDFRVRKLLKRFHATPMKKSHFLLSIMLGRLLIMVPEVLIILGSGMLFFGVPIKGSWPSIFTVALVGAFCFDGIGMLVACRAQRLETISGLMNLIMLPMWMLSGIFFSSDRFPESVQPIIRALPLTQLNQTLRAVILEGAPLASQWASLAVLTAWGLISFLLAKRWFRWS